MNHASNSMAKAPMGCSISSGVKATWYTNRIIASDRIWIYSAPSAAEQIEMMVFMGACCIIALAGPSDPTTAPSALEWVMYRKMPDMM